MPLLPWPHVLQFNLSGKGKNEKKVMTQSCIFSIKNATFLRRYYMNYRAFTYNEIEGNRKKN